MTGRFTTRDTVYGELVDPQSQNRYVYCRNNPHKYTDPNGKNPVLVGALIGGAIGGTVNFGIYAITHQNNFDWDEAIATTAGGVVSGAITGGVGIYAQGYNVLTRIVMNVVADEIAVGFGAATEMLMNEASTNGQYSNHIETIGESFSTAITDPTIDTVYEVATEVYPVPSILKNPYVQDVITETASSSLSYVISHTDEWWNYITTTDFSSNEKSIGVDPLI